MKKSNRRIYSDSFIDGQITKIDALNEKTEEFTPERPNLSDRPYLQKQLDLFIKHRSNLSYVKGFWYGFSLASGIDFDKESK